MPVGTVKKTDHQYAYVRLERQDMCGDCHACEMVSEAKSCEIKCINTCAAKESDRVEVDVATHSFLKATFIMYGIPLIGLVVGILLTGVLLSKMEEGIREFGMIIGGLVVMSGCFFVIHKQEAKACYTTLLPRIKQIIRE